MTAWLLPDPDAEPVASPVVGYRSWHVHNGTLRSLNNQHLEWPTGGQPVTARCYSPGGYGNMLHHNQPPLHTAPHLTCKSGKGCGIYAYTTPSHPAAPRAQCPVCGDHHAYGAVLLSGRVIEHERGYRAERARPLWIASHNPAGREVAAAYGCEYVPPNHAWNKAAA